MFLSIGQSILWDIRTNNNANWNERNELLMKEYMYCPICDREHEVDIIYKRIEVIVKNQRIECMQKSYRCGNANDENEFANGKTLNENLLAVKDAYRAQNRLLTSDEIREIREKYQLTQVELSTLLDWGEVTITRYETKQIQDEAHNDILVLISQDPKEVYDRLQEHRKAFNETRFEYLKGILLEKIKTQGISNAKRKVLEEVYAPYDMPSELNGNKVLDIDKTVDVISYIATFVPGLTKVKLMKMLWYADMLSYQRTEKSLTGLVYLHEQFGALPHGHREMLLLDEVGVNEDYMPQYDRTMIKITSKIPAGAIHLTEIEKNVLDTVIAKFKRFKAEAISEYMHQETAYLKTRKNQPISFKYASELKPF